MRERRGAGLKPTRFTLDKVAISDTGGGIGVRVIVVPDRGQTNPRELSWISACLGDSRGAREPLDSASFDGVLFPILIFLKESIG